MFSLYSSPTDAPLPLIEPVDAGVDLRPFRVHDAESVTAALQGLLENRETVTFHGVGGGKLSGRIIGFLPHERRFVVEAEGDVLPASGPTCCVAMPDGVKLQFHSGLDWERRSNGKLRGRGEWPAEIASLQRRNEQRVEVPVGVAVRAELRWQGVARTLNVDDLSLGGVGLRGSLDDAHGIAENDRLKQVSLLLGEQLVLVIDVDVRSRWNFRSFLAGRQVHLGCRFVEVHPAVLPELRRLLGELEKSRG